MYVYRVVLWICCACGCITVFCVIIFAWDVGDVSGVRQLVANIKHQSVGKRRDSSTPIQCALFLHVINTRSLLLCSAKKIKSQEIGFC